MDGVAAYTGVRSARFNETSQPAPGAELPEELDLKAGDCRTTLFYKQDGYFLCVWAFPGISLDVHEKILENITVTVFEIK